METSKANTKTLYDIYCGNIKEPVTYNTFKKIIHEFHKQITPKILSGYKFNPHGGLGTFHILLNHRTKGNNKYPDWHASKKRKKEILDRQGLLYEEWYEDKDGNKVDKQTFKSKEGEYTKKDNGGEKWMIYFNDPYYFGWNWYKDKNTKFTRHLTKYNFDATRKNKRLVSTIKDKTDIPQLIYGIHRKAGK
jgi:hypothetical protein